jgi:hypothetical protein
VSWFKSRRRDDLFIEAAEKTKEVVGRSFYKQVSLRDFKGASSGFVKRCREGLRVS